MCNLTDIARLHGNFGIKYIDAEHFVLITADNVGGYRSRRVDIGGHYPFSHQCIEKTGLAAGKSTTQSNDIFADQLVIQNEVSELFVFGLEIGIQFIEILGRILFQRIGDLFMDHLFDTGQINLHLRLTGILSDNVA